MNGSAALAVLALSASLLAQQSDRARTEALAGRATERLQSLHREADRLASEERTLLGDLRTLELDRQIKAEELRQLDVQASTAAEERTTIDQDVRRLEQEEQAERPALQARLVALYKLGGARYVHLMLSLSDVRQVGEASRMVASLARRDHDRIVAHQRRLGVLVASRAGLVERGRRLTALRAEAAKARAAAGAAVEDRNALVRDIDERRDLNAQLAGELLAAQQRLQARLRDAVADSLVDEPAVLPLRPFQGELDWPVNGSIRQRFGQTAGSDRPPSNGIEIAAAEGTPVTAVHDGAVAFADTFTGFGKMVILDHGSQTFSVYGNLLDISVPKGARIEAGRPIGLVGPSVTGAAGLHFELRVDGRPVDPLQWLKRR
jgi:septal ring factor EnvC (AmiA/AmiB activator)